MNADGEFDEFILEWEEQSLLSLKHAEDIVETLTKAHFTEAQQHYPEYHRGLLGVFHSLKGSSGFFGADDIVDLMATLEDILQDALPPQIKPDQLKVLVRLLQTGIDQCLYFFEGDLHSHDLVQARRSIKETWTLYHHKTSSPTAAIVAYNGVTNPTWKRLVSAFIKKRAWKENESLSDVTDGDHCIGLFDNYTTAKSLAGTDKDVPAFVLDNEDRSEEVIVEGICHVSRCSLGLLGYTINQYLQTHQLEPDQRQETPSKTDMLVNMSQLYQKCQDFLQTVQEHTDISDKKAMPSVWEMRQRVMRVESTMRKVKALMTLRNRCKDCSEEQCDECETKQWNLLHTMFQQIHFELENTA